MERAESERGAWQHVHGRKGRGISARRVPVAPDAIAPQPPNRPLNTRPRCRPSQSPECFRLSLTKLGNAVAPACPQPIPPQNVPVQRYDHRRQRPGRMARISFRMSPSGSLLDRDRVNHNIPICLPGTTIGVEPASAQKSQSDDMHRAVPSRGRGRCRETSPAQTRVRIDRVGNSHEGCAPLGA